MARGLVAGSSQYLDQTTYTPTAWPVSLALWFYPTDTGIDNEVFSIADASAVDGYISIGVRSDGADFRSRARAVTTYTWGAVKSVNTWFHMGCAFLGNGANDVLLYDDGTKYTGNSAVILTSNFDRITIGRLGDSSPSNYSSGYVAEAAIWDVQLTDAEFAILAAGYCPLFVRPESLQLYVPLVRDNDKDLIRSLTWSPTNSPTVQDHPPIIYRLPPMSIVAEGVTGETVTVDTLTLSSSGLSLTDVTPGTISTLLDELILSGSLESINISGGELSILLDELTLASSTESISILGGVASIILAELDLLGSAEAINFAAGEATLLLDELTLSSSSETISFIIGEVTLPLDELSLVSSAETLTDVAPGTVSIILDELTLVSSIELLSITLKQILYPISDISTGSWTAKPTGTSLYAMLDETSPDDDDYIQSGNNPSADTCEVLFSPGSDPLSSIDHTINYRFKKLGNGTINLTFYLMEGATQRATWSENDVTGSVVQNSYTLSSGEADSITDYTDLRLRMSADVP